MEAAAVLTIGLLFAMVCAAIVAAAMSEEKPRERFLDQL
jgi:hypothetical protein